MSPGKSVGRFFYYIVLPLLLTICTFVNSAPLTQSLNQILRGDRYIWHAARSESDFFDVIEQHKHHIDCLVLEDNGSLQNVIHRLFAQGTLLPVVILPKESPETPRQATINNQPTPNQTTNNSSSAQTNHLFHAAEVRIELSQLPEISSFIDKAITQFVSLSPGSSLPYLSTTAEIATELSNRSFLLQQQRRLSEKLKERLGYLGVYYKRNPQLFLRHLPPIERQKLLENLKSEYRQIVLKYFSQDNTLNQRIDNFVDKAFFADISVSRIVEIHMELMEEFSKQLKLEGRSEEILLDYRLTLIDVIAHLGEMYRRSIPREA
jgi:circadian clock protein KaiA